MKSQLFSRWLLPAFTFGCIFALAPSAIAQSTLAPIRTAIPVATSTVRPLQSTAGKLPRADRFKTAAAASAHCPGDIVVWSSLSSSKAFHLAGSSLYGKTKHGAYVCEKDALTAGYHASKT